MHVCLWRLQIIQLHNTSEYLSTYSLSGQPSSSFRDHRLTCLCLVLANEVLGNPCLTHIHLWEANKIIQGLTWFQKRNNLICIQKLPFHTRNYESKIWLSWIFKPQTTNLPLGMPETFSTEPFEMLHAVGSTKVKTAKSDQAKNYRDCRKTHEGSKTVGHDPKQSGGLRAVALLQTTNI